LLILQPLIRNLQASVTLFGAVSHTRRLTATLKR
jgi:hypothetical protein